VTFIAGYSVVSYVARKLKSRQLDDTLRDQSPDPMTEVNRKIHFEDRTKSKD
jgi:hypothetical protein